MAVNPWLIVVAVLMFAVCVVVNFYMLVYFQHPEDKTVAWVPKIVVVGIFLKLDYFLNGGRIAYSHVTLGCSKPVRRL